MFKVPFNTGHFSSQSKSKKMEFSRNILTFLFLYLTLTSLDFPAEIGLFHIERNKNKNQVHYAIRLDKNCKPKNKEPIYVYWLDLEAKTPEISSLTWIDQPAYGIQKQTKTSDSQVKLLLKALPNKVIYVQYFKDKKRNTCKASASTKISNKKSTLRMVYVFAKATLFIPVVQYIDIFGKLPNGSSVKERILP